MTVCLFSCVPTQSQHQSQIWQHQVVWMFTPRRCSILSIRCLSPARIRASRVLTHNIRIKRLDISISMYESQTFLMQNNKEDMQFSQFSWKLPKMGTFTRWGTKVVKWDQSWEVHDWGWSKSNITNTTDLCNCNDIGTQANCVYKVWLSNQFLLEDNRAAGRWRNWPTRC